MVAPSTAERLCTKIGAPADQQAPPQPLIHDSRRGYGLTKRFVCRTCQHVTNVNGVSPTSAAVATARSTPSPETT